MKFPHLLESYREQIANLPGLEADLGADNPRISRSKATAEETLASYYMANNDDRYHEHLHAALLHRIDWWKNGYGMGAWDFILYTCVSLVVDDMNALQELLEMEVKTDGYARVTVEWYGLHKAVLLDSEYVPRQVKKTKGEERIFKVLTDMSMKLEPDWSDFDAYWKSTRNRSHELTILQHYNLLKDGMIAFWNLRNNTQQGAQAEPSRA